MPNEQERIKHEALKALLKQTIQDNPGLTSQQKHFATANIDRAAEQADWIMEMMRLCGYLK